MLHRIGQAMELHTQNGNAFQVVKPKLCNSLGEGTQNLNTSEPQRQPSTGRNKRTNEGK